MKYLCALLSFLSITQAVLPAGTRGDFDGDGKTDVVVVRTESSLQKVWYVLNSGNGSFRAVPWGQTFPVGDLMSDDTLVGDFDGDGKSDFAVWRHGNPPNPPQAYFYILRSSDLTFQIFSWGVDQDRPVIQDYDGDGKDDPAVVRLATWYVLQSRDGIRIEDGGCCQPHAGDYDGDGKGDLAASFSGPQTSFFRYFFVKKSTTGILETTKFGLFEDYATPGDYDGDGKTDLAVWRGRNVVDGMWYWQRSSDGQIAGVSLGLGSPLGHLPVPGDYDGDGRTDPAIAIRDSTQSPNWQFWILGGSAGLSVTPWGLCQLNPDQPLMVRTTTQ